MDTYVNLNTGKYPVTLEEVRKELLKVSLPKQPTYDQLLRYDYSRVIPVQRPSGTHVVEKYPRYRKGRFYQTWEVVESTDLTEWQHDLTQRLDTVYHSVLNQGWECGKSRFQVTDVDALNWFFLECLYLREEDSDETAVWYTTEHNAVEFRWEEGLSIAKHVIAYKRRLKRGYDHYRNAILGCRDINECKAIKRQLEAKDVFQC